MNKNILVQIEEKLDLYFGKKAPVMPENIKELIVKYSPYIAIAVLVFSLPALLLAFGLTSVAMPFAYMNSIRSGFSFSITSLITLAALVFQVIAIPGLLKRTKQSWRYMFYASLISLLSALLNLDLGSLIIGGAISFYILFQIKSYYKN
ncbi:MAG TPA: hypothetical protein VN174_04605 [Candidatus Methanoperedens sp.]|nr:hypothetical protein [Candidatus Methanoperedens sp.]